MNLSMLLYQAGTTDSLIVFDRDRWQIFSKAIPRPAQVFQKGFLGAERSRPDILRYVNALNSGTYKKGFLQMSENLGFKGPLEVFRPPEKSLLLPQDLVQAASE